LTIPSSYWAKKCDGFPLGKESIDGIVNGVNSDFVANIFPQRLKEVRELRALSQSELAKKSNLQATAISHFETGGRAPSFDNLRKLADALNVATDYLIGRTNELKLAGPESDNLFRGLEQLSEADLGAIRMMKEALLAKKREGGA
jgi:transcriptional regulator with XRE-family HTH domain